MKLDNRNVTYIIRDYRDSDNILITKIWMEGFHEMCQGPNGSIKKMQTSFWPISIFGSLGTLVYIFQGPITISTLFIAFGISLYTPIGSYMYSAALWQAIKAQGKKSMAVSTFHSIWLNPGNNVIKTAEWDKTRTHFFVAQRSDDPLGIPVGCVGVKSIHTLHHEKDTLALDTPNEASIWRLSVDSNLRGSGIGRLLMSSAEKWAKEHGCKNMSLITGNEDSKIFYQKIGYKTETEERALSVLQLSNGILGFIKKRMLKVRLYDYRTIFRKQI